MLKTVRIFRVLLLWATVASVSFFNVDVACAQKSALEPVTIQLRWFHQFQFAGYYAAIEQGFYADEGLQVSLREFEPGKDRIAPVLEGKAQYGVGDPSLLKLRMQGKPVVVLAQIFQHSPNVLITLRESGIFSADELAGKRVMLSLDDIGRTSIQAMILKEVGDLKRITIVPQTYNDEQLINGDVDAISAYLSNEPFKLKLKGIRVNTIDPRSYGIDYYGDNLFTTEKEVNEHPERVDKMIRATLKGWAYALEHKDDIINLILTKYNSDLNREQLRYEAKVIDQMIVPELVSIGEINPRRYDRIAETLHRLGMSQSSAVPDGFIYAVQPEPLVPLTTQERAWLAENPKVRIALFDLPPAQFKKDGTFTGYQVDMLEAMLQKAGLEPIYSFSTLAEVLKSLRNRNADIALDFIQTPERGQRVFFSEKTYNMVMAIFGRENRTDLDSIDALKNKVIASYIGYGFEPTLKRHLPEARIVRADNPLGMLRLVASGKADAAVHEIASGEQMLRKNLIINVVSHGEFLAGGESRLEVSEYVVRKDLPLLMSILDKAYASLNEAEKQTIWNRWFTSKKPMTAKSTVSLTPEEQAWLKAHPNIQLGYNDAFEPTVIVDPDGSYRGIIVDILDALNKRIGTHIALRVDPIPIMHEKAKTKETDGIALLHPNYADKLGFLKTHSFYRSYPIVFGRISDRFEHPDDFIGKKVAIIDKIFFSKKIIKPYIDRVTVVKVKDAREGLEMVHRKEADLFIGLSPNNYLISKHRFFGLSPKYIFYGLLNKFGMAIRPDWPELVSILNKGISSFPEKEIDAIVNKWLQLPQKKDVVELNTEEQAWLSQDHIVRVRLAQHPPYSFIENGELVGIAIDFINKVHELTGIKFQFAENSPPFRDDLQRLIRHEGPDLIPAIDPKPEREQFILFTQPYVIGARFIFTRDDAEFVASMADLSGKTVAVIKGHVVPIELSKNYPDIKPLFYKNNEQALRAVSSGKAFAFIGGIFSTPIMINKFRLKNLKAAAPSPLPEGRASMGIRNDWPELRDIMNKVFDAIPAHQKSAIVNKWASVKIEYGIRPLDVIKWILVLAGSASVILILFLFWNRSLAKMVRVRTVELESSNKSLAVEVSQRTTAEMTLRESRDYLKNLTDSMADAIFSVKMPERTIEWANDTYNVLGYEPDECVDRTTEFLYPSKEDFLAFGNEIKRAISEGKDVLHFEQNLRNKNGELFPAEITVSFFRTNENVVSVTSIVRNIAERKQAEQKIWEYQHRLKSLASQLTITEERERRRIAADLHDQIGQTLALARMQLNGILEAQSEIERNMLVKDISHILLKSLQDTRSLIFELSSPTLNEIGLGAAISEWLEEHVEKRYGLKTEFIDEIDEKLRKTLDNNVRAVLFRNVRELFTNVIKHAKAEKVSVHLKAGDGIVTVIVEDDGIGFDPQTATPLREEKLGYGLFSIQERMSDLGGSFDIQSEPGKGCRAVLTLPVGTNKE